MKEIDLPQLPRDTTQQSDELLPAYKMACKNMHEFLSGKRTGGEAIRQSAITLSAYGRILASETNRAGMRMMAMRMDQQKKLLVK